MLQMQKIAELWRRLLFLLRRGQLDRELEEEMRLHLDMKIEENGQCCKNSDSGIIPRSSSLKPAQQVYS